ncbi:hypothetical protein RFI_25613 [Reticulomyxa filosa]|uniref:Uncharacterized protein n=1 Tax=Reticulomyxa filosa TaxID=46433 RepID=X6MCZ3_RETFI|nr:hypothetical protein RFI_25613 [Reticulomyxa filosa]|eukprot:ETO11764.1 hypothetical protein RFI_25613 [Reticulomyxa filosa]
MKVEIVLLVTGINIFFSLKIINITLFVCMDVGEKGGKLLMWIKKKKRKKLEEKREINKKNVIINKKKRRNKKKRKKEIKKRKKYTYKKTYEKKIDQVNRELKVQLQKHQKKKESVLILLPKSNDPSLKIPIEQGNENNPSNNNISLPANFTTTKQPAKQSEKGNKTNSITIESFCHCECFDIEENEKEDGKVNISIADNQAMYGRLANFVYQQLLYWENHVLGGHHCGSAKIRRSRGRNENSNRNPNGSEVQMLLSEIWCLFIKDLAFINTGGYHRDRNKTASLPKDKVNVNINKASQKKESLDMWPEYESKLKMDSEFKSEDGVVSAMIDRANEVWTKINIDEYLEQQMFHD